MQVENIIEMWVILMALMYSRFARLPLLVVCNILLFSYVTLSLEISVDITIRPWHAIYYFTGAVYFFALGIVFKFFDNIIYNAIAIILFIQASLSGAMIVSNSFAPWHEFINNNAIVIECALVWLSSIKTRGEHE